MPHLKIEKYTDITITYTFGDQQEVLDGDTIVTWIETDGSEITLDETKVADFVEYLRKTYNTIFTKRTFQTSYDIEVTLDKGDYGWWLNTVQETAELTEMIQKGESGERTPVYYQTAASYGTPDYGDTYVEINLTAQHLLLYVDGEMILESDFVSGMLRGDMIHRQEFMGLHISSATQHCQDRDTERLFHIGCRSIIISACTMPHGESPLAGISIRQTVRMAVSICLIPLLRKYMDILKRERR